MALVQLAGWLTNPSPGASASAPSLLAKGQPVPGIAGTTLDGQPFDLASLRGHPVLVNFWGPSCVPCRDEFPLLLTKLGQHASDGFAVVGVLMDDPPAPALEFIGRYAATWPTVNDPNGAFRAAYRVAARPQTYFIDRDGILRSIQVGELTEAEFERQYAVIAGTAAPSVSPAASVHGGTPQPSIEIPPPP